MFPLGNVSYILFKYAWPAFWLATTLQQISPKLSFCESGILEGFFWATPARDFSPSQKQGAGAGTGRAESPGQQGVGRAPL